MNDPFSAGTRGRHARTPLPAPAYTDPDVISTLVGDAFVFPSARRPPHEADHSPSDLQMDRAELSDDALRQVVHELTVHLTEVERVLLSWYSRTLVRPT